MAKKKPRNPEYERLRAEADERAQRDRERLKRELAELEARRAAERKSA
jgi:hypothetical protein